MTEMSANPQPQTDLPRADLPRTERPRTELPRTDLPRAEPPLTDLPLTALTRVRRGAHHQRTDRAALYDVIDGALSGTLAIVRDDRPVALPIGIGRDGDDVLLHGSTGSDFFRRIAAGAPVCLTVTHLLGLKYARSLFDSSMRYRCAVVHGVASVVPPAQKEAALLALSEHLMPGRSEDVRPMTARELAATMVLRLPLAEASVKDNAGSLVESDDDGEDRSVWAGMLPLRVVAGDPVTSPQTVAGVPVPKSVGRAARRVAASGTI
ncbi:pyridoxamine 5'-phosphate oxidase family protein [Microbacterium sp. 22296]|uniref:pyridoxamine 5'-phosphate oxidase family protein n=1 Tax=Microbacterium sp. 22296 TaxID=3453903 RepID=UPI003F87F11B